MTTTSPHIGRRVSVFPADARLPERKARIVGGSRSKGFQVQFEDGAEPKTALVGPSGYRYISDAQQPPQPSRTVEQSAVRVCLAMMGEDPFKFGALTAAAALTPEDMDALMRAIECAREADAL